MHTDTGTYIGRISLNHAALHIEKGFAVLQPHTAACICPHYAVVHREYTVFLDTGHIFSKVNLNTYSTVFFHIPAVHGKASKTANVNTSSVRCSISFDVSVFQRHITQNKQAAAAVHFICTVRIRCSASTADGAVFHLGRIVNYKFRALLYIDGTA